MAYYRDERGYTRGGIDVTEAVNLFFKGILLFPVFLLAGYIGVIMMKHVIFNGIPSITTPTEEQRQRIHDRNQEIEPETTPHVPQSVDFSEVRNAISPAKVRVIEAEQPLRLYSGVTDETRDPNARGGFDPRYDRR